MTSLRDVKRMSVTLVGVVLLFAAVFAASYAVAHQEHQHHAAAVLIESERAAMAKIAKQSHGASCQVAGVQPGQLSGILSIPALDMTAPVEEGTDDQELNVAVGHDPQSVWPGLNGAAVFLAHDVSYFVHLNQLKPGDVITYRTACNTVKFAVSGQQVVAAGSPVANTTGPSMVLDTCWPPNALFFTPDRLLVRATEVGAATKGANLNAGAQFIRTVKSTDYTTSAPPALQAQGLTLEQNEAPMGTMNLVNASVAFSQSPGRSRSRPRRSRPTSAACTPAPSGRRPGGPPSRPAWPCRHSSPGRSSPATTPRSTWKSTRRGEPDPGGAADRGDPAGGLRPWPARHDGRSPCSRGCRRHRELDLQLSVRCARKPARDRKGARRHVSLVETRGEWFRRRDGQMSFDEMYDEMLHDEFRSRGTSRGKHAAPETAEEEHEGPRGLVALPQCRHGGCRRAGLCRAWVPSSAASAATSPSTRRPPTRSRPPEHHRPAAGGGGQPGLPGVGAPERVGRRRSRILVVALGLPDPGHRALPDALVPLAGEPARPRAPAGRRGVDGRHRLGRHRWHRRHRDRRTGTGGGTGTGSGCAASQSDLGLTASSTP